MKISTSFGKIFVDKDGKGKKILFFHGGPGLSHRYMEPTFKEIKKLYELVFFDQLGCGKSEGIDNVNEENTKLSTSELISNLGLFEDDYYLVLHSWGSYLFGALVNDKLLKRLPKKIILLNPTPFDREGFDAVGGSLVQRVPKDALAKIGELSGKGTDKAGSELMKVALPYYNGHSRDIDKLGEIDYRISTYNKIAQTLPEFNHHSIFKELEEKLFFVFGETDYISKDYFNEYANDLNSIVIEGGHFSFAENPKKIKDLVSKQL